MNRQDLETQYQGFIERHLDLDLTRGKPCPEQLDLSNELLSLSLAVTDEKGTDIRNYGGLKGLAEARRLGSWLLDVPEENVIAGGNSSLNLMYLVLSWWLSISHRNDNPAAPGRFICLVPGYDRHFTLCEHLGYDMISVPLLDDGPDMDKVEELVRSSPDIAGIWCVPKYSNPTGHTFSDEAVKRIAALPSLTDSNFIVMWDNAYSVHHLTDSGDPLSSLFEEAERSGTQDAIAIFGSTSKITFAGAGVGFCSLSELNLQRFEAFMGEQMIGFDKVNQLRHARFLDSREKLAAHMAQHQTILAPKFDAVYRALEPLKEAGLIQYQKPNGGYFVSVDLVKASARAVVELASSAGVKLTPAGATYPYGQDPADSNLRLAPSYPDIATLEQAMEVFVCSVQLASQ